MLYQQEHDKVFDMFRTKGVVNLGNTRRTSAYRNPGLHYVFGFKLVVGFGIAEMVF